MPLLATPRPGCEVRESSAAAARRPRPTMAHGVDCSYVETRLRDTERRMMAALELVNMRVSYQVDVCTRESSEFCTRHHDAQKDRASVKAEIEVLRSERLAYEQEGIQTRETLARSEAYCRALEARVAVLETHVHRLEWQCQAADDLAVQHIMHTQALEAGARDDTLEDTGTEGEVGLTRWIEKMEYVFNISGQIRTFGPDAYKMTWSVLKKKMTDKYCPLGEVKKLEIELWNLKVKDNNIPTYTNRFQELALICTNKRKANDISRNNQQPFKRQNVAKAYNLGSVEKKTYEGNAPKSTGNTNATRGGNGPNPRGNGSFECGNPGHFKRDCPKLYNKNRGNGNTQGWVYVVGNAERNKNVAGNPDSNIVTGTFLLNNRYASILFDTG
nr:hypothetical protein [Tanacetum cinerariifolium]